MQSLCGCKYVKLMRIQYQLIVVSGKYWLPIISNIISVGFVDIYGISKLLSAIADDPLRSAFTGQAYPQDETVTKREIAVDQRMLLVLFSQGAIIDVENKMLFVLRI